MKNGAKFAVVLVTAPSLAVARKLARQALKARLIACANLSPKIESHYIWKGKIERSTEVLMISKTTRSRLPAFEKFIAKHHPYDTPEFVVLSVDQGNQRYLDWLKTETSTTTKIQ